MLFIFNDIYVLRYRKAINANEVRLVYRMR